MRPALHPISRFAIPNDGRVRPGPEKESSRRDEVGPRRLRGGGPDEGRIPRPCRPMGALPRGSGARTAKTFPVDLTRLEPQMAVRFSPEQRLKGVTQAGRHRTARDCFFFFFFFIGAGTHPEAKRLWLGGLCWERRRCSRPGPTTSRSSVPGDLTHPGDPLRRAAVVRVRVGAGSASIRPVAPCASVVARARRAARREGGCPRQETAKKLRENRMGDGIQLRGAPGAAPRDGGGRARRKHGRSAILSRWWPASIRKRFRAFPRGERKAAATPEGGGPPNRPMRLGAGAGATIPSAPKRGRAPGTSSVAGTNLRRASRRFGDKKKSRHPDGDHPWPVCNLTSLPESWERKSISTLLSGQGLRPARSRRALGVVSRGKRLGFGSSREPRRSWRLKGAGVLAFVGQEIRFHPQAQPGQRGVGPSWWCRDPRSTSGVRGGRGRIELDSPGPLRRGGRGVRAEEPSGRSSRRLVGGKAAIVPAIQHQRGPSVEKLHCVGLRPRRPVAIRNSRNPCCSLR